MSVLCERERAGKDKRCKHQWWDVKHLLKCHRKARTCSVTQRMGVPGRMCAQVCVCDRLLLNCAHKTLPTCERWL